MIDSRVEAEAYDPALVDNLLAAIRLARKLDKKSLHQQVASLKSHGDAASLEQAENLQCLHFLTSDERDGGE